MFIFAKTPFNCATAELTLILYPFEYTKGNILHQMFASSLIYLSLTCGERLKINTQRLRVELGESTKVSMVATALIPVSVASVCVCTREEREKTGFDSHFTLPLHLLSETALVWYSTVSV